MRSSSRRFVATALIVFVVFNSGSVGARACDESGNTRSASVSWWPPGARCELGLQPQDPVAFNVVAPVVLLGLVWPFQVIVVASVARCRRRRGAHSAPQAPGRAM